jgi:hypothetical protein
MAPFACVTPFNLTTEEQEEEEERVSISNLVAMGNRLTQSTNEQH